MDLKLDQRNPVANDEHNSQTQTGKKRRLELIDSSQDISEECTSSGVETVVVNGDKTTLRLLLIDPDIDFTILQWKLIADQFDVFSPSWSFIGFSNDLKAVIFTESSNHIAEKFITAEVITCDEREVNICIEEVCGKSRGIIYSKFLIPTSECDILSTLQNQGVSEVYKIQKSDDNGSKFYTGTVILNFERGRTPQSVFFAGVTLHVNKLNPKPMLCSHCGVLGHTIKKCKKLQIPFCKNCFGQHSIEDICFVHCKNCNEPHFSSDKRCEAVLTEIEILKFKESHNISYFDAKSAFKIHGGKHLKDTQSFEERDKIRKLEVTNLKESYAKLSIDLKVARESAANSALQAKEANNKILHFKNVIIPELENEIVTVRKSCENDKIQQQKEFTDSLEENAKEITSLTEQNINTAKQLQKLNDKIQSMNKKYDTLKIRETSKDVIFEEFINFSDLTLKEYQKFYSMKEKDDPNSIGLLTVNDKSRGRSSDRKPISFTSKK